MKRPALLRPFEESIVLLVPFVVLLAALAEGLFVFPWPNGSTQNVFRFVVNVFFLNTLHIVFTFSMLAKLPELRVWVAQKTNNRPALFWSLVLTCLLLFWSFFVFSGAYFFVDQPTRYVSATLLVIVGIVTPGFHNLWQNRGLSLAYHQTAELLPEQRLRIDTCVRWEKQIFRFLFVAYSIQMLSFFGWTLPWQNEMPQAWQELAKNGSLFWIKNISLFFTSTSVLALLVLSWKGPFHTRTRKTLYLTRLVLYPLSAFSYAAMMGILVNHGLEYWAVYRTMTSSSQASLRDKRFLHTLTLFFALVILLCILPGFVLPRNEEPTRWILYMSALGMAVNYTHYVLDRILFKMSEPITRMATGKLLLGSFNMRKDASSGS